MEEIWRDIPEYEGYYQVSNNGRIKSIARLVKGKETSLRFVRERIMSLGSKPAGYVIVVLMKEGGRKTLMVHHLVAKVFLGIKESGLIIDHIDNDKTNNKSCNLQYISRRVNNSKDRSKTSRFIGVYFNRKKWQASIKIGKYIYLGRFEVEQDAADAYQNALRLSHLFTGDSKQFRSLIAV